MRVGYEDICVAEEIEPCRTGPTISFHLALPVHIGTRFTGRTKEIVWASPRLDWPTPTSAAKYPKTFTAGRLTRCMRRIFRPRLAASEGGHERPLVDAESILGSSSTGVRGLLRNSGHRGSGRLTWDKAVGLPHRDRHRSD